MNRRTLHHRLTQIRKLQYWYLWLLFVVFAASFVLAYRHNNVRALQLRDDLLQVDRNNGDTEAALRSLREFTYGHMNANLATGDASIYPPIQLKYRYERLVKAQQDKVETTNAKLYTAAQDYCEQQVTSRVTINRVPCIQTYLETHGGQQIAAGVPDALYKFDFVSPIWSPDLAGFSLILAVLSLLVIGMRYISEVWVVRSLE